MKNKIFDLAQQYNATKAEYINIETLYKLKGKLGRVDLAKKILLENKLNHLQTKLYELGITNKIVKCQYELPGKLKMEILFTGVTEEEAKLLVRLREKRIILNNEIKATTIQPGIISQVL